MANPVAREVVRGRWREILVELAGVEPALLDGKGRACPVCREGTDRFTFDDKEGAGTGLCRRCPADPGRSVAAGGGMELLQLITGWDDKEVAQRIAEHLRLPVYSFKSSPLRRIDTSNCRPERRPKQAPITGPLELAQLPQTWPDEPPEHLPQGFRATSSSTLGWPMALPAPRPRRLPRQEASYWMDQGVVPGGIGPVALAVAFEIHYGRPSVRDICGQAVYFASEIQYTPHQICRWGTTPTDDDRPRRFVEWRDRGLIPRRITGRLFSWGITQRFGTEPPRDPHRPSYCVYTRAVVAGALAELNDFAARKQALVEAGK